MKQAVSSEEKDILNQGIHKKETIKTTFDLTESWLKTRRFSIL